MKRILAAAVIATATLTTLGLAGPSVVSAGTSSHAATAQIGKLYDRGSAGYSMSGTGWRFRYIQTTLTVPASTTRATNASILLIDPATDAVGLVVRSGGGPGSITWFTTAGNVGGALAVQPSVGDLVTISVFHDRAALKDYFTALDVSTGASATAVMTVSSKWVWRAATVIGNGPTWSLATADTRLWAFQDTRLTSYGGTRGAILGPWNTYRIVGTRGATSTGAIVLWPTYPWNNGHNFSVLWRAAS